MNVKVYTEPAIEPVTLNEVLIQLSQSSGSIADNSTLYTSIASGSHPVTAGYALFGTGIDVLGKTAVVNLIPVNNGVGATVDAKIQESDVLAGPYTDWVGGAFTRITEANDTVIQEKQYTGSKKYIRLATQTLVQACEFGAYVTVWEPISSDDTLLTELIIDARIGVERDTGRKIITQTIDYFPPYFPAEDRIKLPFGNLQSIVSFTYKDMDGVEYTLVENTDFIVELNGTECGFVVLPHDGSWPSDDLYPSNPITIRYTCGYGATADSVPATVKQAIKRMVVNSYMNRGDDVVGYTIFHDKTYQRCINRIGILNDMDFI